MVELIKNAGEKFTDFNCYILSIDLDYLTNNLTRDDSGDLIQTNKFKFEFIKKLVDKYKDKIKMVKDHGSILKVVTQGNLDLYKLHVTNIDHHHDIWYSEESKKDILRNATYFKTKIPEYSLESDWLGWLAANYDVIRIEEILNENSIVDKSLHQYGIRFYYDLGSPLRPYGLNILDRSYDFVVIATSPNYTTDEEINYVLDYLGLTNMEVMD